MSSVTTGYCSKCVSGTWEIEMGGGGGGERERERERERFMDELCWRSDVYMYIH